LASNALHCAIVVSGTRDALAAMQTEDQIASRFPAFELTRWRQNEELRRFLADTSTTCSFESLHTSRTAGQ